MNEEELRLILEEGEGYKTEFRENASGAEKDIAAFANSSGGRIFIGVTDEGRIGGIRVTNELRSRIQDMANGCRPKIKISIDGFENILIVSVKEGEDKPYECSSGFFKRIGPNSQKLTRDQIVDLFKSEGKVRFDELIEPRFAYPGDFDQERFLKFLDISGISKAADTEKILLNLGVAEKQEGRLYFNNAGVLFFAKEPQRFVPWSVFTVVLFKDYGGSEIIDRKEVTGSLFEIVEKVMDFVRLYAKVAYRFTGKPQRENIYEYPFEALREAVINSVMHKYYFEHGHNNILRFFPDRIRIENFWSKPKNFKLGETVFRRNQMIAELFTRMHLGEKLGTGFERIKEACRKENAPFPEIELNESYFYVTFRQSQEYLKMAKTAPDRLVEGLVEGLVENQRKILELVKKNPYISKEEMSRITGISTTAIDKNIESLKKKSLLKRVGPDKGGHWEVIK